MRTRDRQPERQQPRTQNISLTGALDRSESLNRRIAWAKNLKCQTSWRAGVTCRRMFRLRRDSLWKSPRKAVQKLRLVVEPKGVISRPS